MPKYFASEVLDDPNCGHTDLPIFMGHGSFDPMLPMQMGIDSRAFLEDAGFTVEWHEYPMAHAVCAAEIDDIHRWLLSVFGD